MQSTEILEGNKLIAEFMGAVAQPHVSGTLYWFENVPTEFATHQWNDYAMQYHTSWDWLMPVWWKIKCYGVAEYGVYWKQEITDSCVCIDTTKHKIFSFYWMINREDENPIKDVWFAIVEFLKWYNTQTKQNG